MLRLFRSTFTTFTSVLLNWGRGRTGGRSGLRTEIHFIVLNIVVVAGDPIDACGQRPALALALTFAFAFALCLALTPAILHNSALISTCAFTLALAFALSSSLFIIGTLGSIRRSWDASSRWTRRGRTRGLNGHSSRKL